MKYLFWIYYEGNDLQELNNEIKSETLSNYLKNSNYTQNLDNKQEKINNYLSVFLKENKKIDDELNFFSLKNILSILGADRTRSLIFF